MWNTEFTGVWWNAPLMMTFYLDEMVPQKSLMTPTPSLSNIYKVPNIMSLSEPKSSACPQL